MYIPNGNTTHAELTNRYNIYAIDSLIDIIDHLNKIKVIRSIEPKNDSINTNDSFNEPYSGEIYGQDTAKRTLVVAMTSSHNVLMTNPPDTGKPMLAKVFMSILPGLTPQSIPTWIKTATSYLIKHRQLYAYHPGVI
ncbi:MAG: ATP-binding protein [Candidatus Saccharibacteria bacterium]